jgi:hypothetical protein
MEKLNEWVSATDEGNVNEGLKLTIADFKKQGCKERPLMIVFYPENSGASSNVELDEFKKWLTSEYECCCIQGHPLGQGNSRVIIGDETNHEIVRIEDHPELMEEVFLPGHLRNSTQFIVYHTYFGQLKHEHLQYVLGLWKKTSIPTLLLINDYSYINELDSQEDLSVFNMIHYNKP